jgi:hypothetical protein
MPRNSDSKALLQELQHAALRNGTVKFADIPKSKEA